MIYSHRLVDERHLLSCLVSTLPGTQGALQLVRRTFLVRYTALAVRLLPSLEHRLAHPARAPFRDCHLRVCS